MSDSPTRPDPYPPGALPIGSRLGEFEVRGVLGVGGFGIVYRAFDHLLEREVALKEYMPATLAGRTATMHISLLSETNADTFALGLRSFVNEARLLARFDHPSLVKVHRFWEANGTAYMAMALYKGRTVRDVRLEMRQPPGEAWVRRLLEPLLGAIERLHGEDVYHRDIAPDNILLEADGRPVLLDFGAARRVISDKSQNLTAILKPSYAPIEQYADTPGMKQGPWTDIYAVGATVHFLLLGRPPPPAPARAIQDQMPPLALLEGQGCSPAFLALLDWMLAPLPEDRPQTVAEVQEVLAGRAEPPARGAAGPDIDLDCTLPLPQNVAPQAPAEATQVVPPSRMPAAREAADDATVILPRTGVVPPRTALPPPAAPAAFAPAQPPTMVVPRQPAPRPTTFDEDATVVTPRGAGIGPTGLPQAAPPIPPTMAYRPPASAGSPAPARAAAPVPQAARRGVHWAIPVAAGVVVVGALGAWLWPRSTSQVASYGEPASAATAAPMLPAASTPSLPAAAPSPPPEPAASSISPPVSPPPAVEPAPAAAPRPAVLAAPAARVPPPSKPAPAKPALTRPEPTPVKPVDKPPVVAAPVVPVPAPAPAAVKPEPAPAPAPVVLSPSERCRNQLPLVRLVCIDIECGKAELASHPECVKLRADQARVRERVPGN